MARVKMCSKCGKLIDKELEYCKECTSIINRDYNRYKRDMDMQKIYNSKAWRIARGKAIHRDMGLCIACYSNKTITSMQVVHHIEELKDNQSKAFKLNNLICLCESCHQKIHKIYESENKNKIQVELKKMIS